LRHSIDLLENHIVIIARERQLESKPKKPHHNPNPKLLHGEYVNIKTVSGNAPDRNPAKYFDCAPLRSG
jgi:hypothetical protein